MRGEKNNPLKEKVQPLPKLLMFESKLNVKLKEDTHQYFDVIAREYLSVSKFLHSFTTEKDWNKLLSLSAKKKGVSLEMLKKEWENKKNNSAAEGTRLHNILQRYSEYGVVDEKDRFFKSAVYDIHKLFTDYKKSFNEQPVFSEKHLLAGTIDKACFFSEKNKKCIDIYDYKTNKEKGIQYENSYGDYFKPPIDHLQECNYLMYVLQLSLYARMIEITWGYKIGKLSLIFIPLSKPEQWFLIPVPYMKAEVDAMLAVKELSV